MCLVRFHIACNEFYCQNDSFGNDWCVIPLKLKGANLDLYSVYLTDGLGYAGDNISKLTEVAASVNKRPNEYIILGDFNIPRRTCWHQAGRRSSEPPSSMPAILASPAARE